MANPTLERLRKQARSAWRDCGYARGQAKRCEARGDTEGEEMWKARAIEHQKTAQMSERAANGIVDDARSRIGRRRGFKKYGFGS